MTLIMVVTAAIETFNFKSTNPRSTLTQLIEPNCYFIGQPQFNQCNRCSIVILIILSITSGENNCCFKILY